MTQKLFVIAFVASLAGLGYGQRSVQNRPRLILKPPVAQPQPPQKGTHPPKEVTVTGVGGALVDWSYIRMNNPALFAASLDRVRSGNAKPKSLGGLTTPENLHLFLALPQVPVATPPVNQPPVTQPPKTAAKRRVIQKSNAGLKVPTSEFDTSVAERTNFKALLPLDVSPKSVNFGGIVDGQSVRQVVYVTMPANGALNVDLKNDPAFKIVSVKALDGMLAFSSKNKLTGSLINTGRGEITDAMAVAKASSYVQDAAANNAKATSVRRRALSTSAQSTFRGTNLKGAIQPVSLYKTEATSAPFQVYGKEGQRVRIIVEFKPHFDLFSGDYVGIHNASLEIDSNGQTQSVPLRAKFDGVNIGVIVIPEDREVTLVVSAQKNPGKTGVNAAVEQHFSVGTRLTISNPGPPCTITVFADSANMPAGVSSGYDQQIKVPTGQSSNYVDFNVTFRGIDDYGAQYGYGQEIPLTIITPQRRFDVVLTMNVLPAMRMFEWHGALDDVAYRISVLATSDGYVNTTCAFNTTNYWNTDLDFRFKMNGTEYFSEYGLRVPTHADINLHPQIVSPGTLNPQLALDWDKIAFSQGSLWLRVSEHP